MSDLPEGLSDWKDLPADQLYPYEVYWRDRYVWLKENGYLLRPRYNPEWVPSWKDTNKLWLTCEDGQVSMVPHILMDATRISDGAQLMLKVLEPSNRSEIEFYQFFSEEPQKSDAKNHCIPYEGFLKMPDTDNFIVALPMLYHWDDPEFDTVGEAIDLFRQIFEVGIPYFSVDAVLTPEKGLEYIHSFNIAHNDIKRNNIMMDSTPLYGEAVHPVNSDKSRDYTRWIKPGKRTLKPVKYYHIDFGHMCRYNPGPEPPTIFVGPDGYGGDMSVPEFKSNANSMINPFPVDVYRIGNVIRICFLDGDESGDGKMEGLGFMRPLLLDMCQDDPIKRPTMSEVLARFEKLIQGLSWWELRGRVAPVKERRLVRVFRSPVHWAKQVFRVMRRIPAIPRFPPG